MNNHPFPHSLLSTSKCFCLLLVTLIVALSDAGLISSSYQHVTVTADSRVWKWDVAPKSKGITNIIFHSTGNVGEYPVKYFNPPTHPHQEPISSPSFWDQKTDSPRPHDPSSRSFTTGDFATGTASLWAPGFREVFGLFFHSHGTPMAGWFRNPIENWG